MRNFAALVILFLSSTCQQKQAPPEPVMPVPHERQLAWQEMEFYGFIHFSVNTFSDREWGYGDEDPKQFNPTALDARQWARIAKEAGMTGLIFSAKHHDGFVTYPSAYTEHSVKNSPWRDGKGDLIREFVDACSEYGLKAGIYYSPWDRNHPDYGKPEYLTYMRNQLRELLTNYGEIFEVWFDGANGGDGWYGGADEMRKVDKRSYYDWPTTYAMIRELQPNAVIFGDAGLDVRWVGNEHGYAYETTWSNLMRDSVYGGMPEYAKKWSAGQENGTHWVPAEADVSIRPGWYYHAYEDHRVKSLSHLMDIYYRSVGQNASLLLNFPVDTRGLIHENDEAAVLKMAAKIREDFQTNLAQNAKITASKDRGYGYQADLTIDGEYESYWTLPDGELQASLEVDMGEAMSFNRVLIQEYTPLGQRVKAFSIEAFQDGTWNEIAKGTTVGYKRIMRFPDVTASQVRINFEDGKAMPVISEIGIFYAPKLLLPPVVSRDPSGVIQLEAPDDNLEIRYSLDGSEPSLVYSEPFPVMEPHTLRAISVDSKTGKKSDEIRKDIDLPKGNWKTEAPQAIDENTTTFVALAKNVLQVDLGTATQLKGFTYFPMQARYPSGHITNYSFEVSDNGWNWNEVAQGEFSNVVNSPIEQLVQFEPTTARYIRLKAVRTADGNPATVAELGIVTQ